VETEGDQGEPLARGDRHGDRQRPADGARTQVTARMTCARWSLAGSVGFGRLQA